MPQPSLTDLQYLITKAVFPFYQVQRHVPLKFAPGRYENDAEHSWSVAFFACALAPAVDVTLDIGKVCQFAIVHDMVEIYAGDTSNFAPAAEKATKDEREQQALLHLQNEFVAFPWVGETISVYERQDTPEARFVKSVDKIIILVIDLIEEGLFYQENKITIEAWQQQMQKHREKAKKHAGAFVYYDEIWHALLSHPEFFYQHKAQA